MNECEYEAAARYWTSKENDATRMPDEQLKEAIDDFLTSHNTCALACASGDFVRCTPLEYAYREGAIWIFSEGGLKFAALEHNKNVRLAIYEPYAGFGTLASAQVTGVAKIVDPDSAEFADAASAKGIKPAMFDKIKTMLHLIKVTPTSIDYLASSLKELGFDSRQHLDC